MTGFHNNIAAITEKIANGTIRVTREGNKVAFSGSTYEHKDFLKSEFGCRWDRDTKSWVATDLSESYLNLLDQMMGIEDEEPETEEATESAEIVSDYIEVLDENESTGETLYAVKVLTGDVVSIIIAEDGTEYFNDDWQSTQPKTFDEVGDWRWYRGEEIDF